MTLALSEIHHRDGLPSGQRSIDPDRARKFAFRPHDKQIVRIRKDALSRVIAEMSGLLPSEHASTLIPVWGAGKQ